MARFLDKEGKPHVVDDDKVEQIKAEMGLPSKYKKRVYTNPIKVSKEVVEVKKKDDSKKAKCPVCGGTNVHYKKGCLDCKEKNNKNNLLITTMEVL